MSIYIPPENIDLPFEFTNQGYTPPNNTDILFNFAEKGSLGTLRAAVNVMSPYWYTTHTYTKACPRYVVGYGLGGVQIIKGRCLFGGIRDLQGIIHCMPEAFTRGNLLSFINPILNSSYSYLSASMRILSTENTKDLNSFITGFQTIDLSAQLGAHNAITLPAAIRARRRSNQFLMSSIYGWQRSDLGIILSGTHSPIDLKGQLRASQRSSSSLSSYIYAWHARYLNASLNIVIPFDLTSSLYTIPPSNLSGYIKARLYKSLSSSVRGWQDINLGAIINQIWGISLTSSIYSRTDMKNNLSSRITGYGVDYKDLYGTITAFHWHILEAIIRATYVTNIGAYIYAIVPEDLSGRVHAWHERFLQGILNCQNYPWNLMAQICSSGDWSTFTASIQPRQNVGVYGNLTTTIHPWEHRDFSAYILGSGAPVLSAYINPLGYANDLHGSIRPKMIRLTTIINIPTQPHYDLSATINYPCFKTGYVDLSAYIYTKYKSDLSAYIKAIYFNYKPMSLPAKIGYTDSYLEVDKLKLSINIYPNEFFTEDKFKLLLSLLDADSLLTAYIKGTLRYSGISARIVGEDISSYIFDNVLQNREIVVHKTYDGIFKEFEAVEMLFKSAVKDYFFSSAGGFAWKSDRFDKWVFSVKSILPPDTDLHTIRRLHRATSIYDLKKFSSIDEAIRAAIAYVTEYPQSNLRASITNLGTYSSLSCVIVPKYTIRTRSSLESTITPVGNSIFINEKETITKI